MKLINTLTLITWVAIMLVACGWTNGDSLNGTTWELYSIGKYSPVAGSKTTIQFDDGQVSGLGGCNHYGGEYQTSGDRLSFDKLNMTEMACMSPEGVMDQENAYLQFLGDARKFELADNHLKLYGSGGEALTFVRVE